MTLLGFAGTLCAKLSVPLLLVLLATNIFLLVLPLVSEARNKASPRERRHLSTSAWTRLFINVYAFWLLWSQQNHLVLLLKSAVELSEIAELWVVVFSNLFLGALLLTVARGFYVISAFDGGYYNLSPELPKAIGKNSSVRYAEFLIRLSIALLRNCSGPYECWA